MFIKILSNAFSKKFVNQFSNLIEEENVVNNISVNQADNPKREVF